MGDYCSTEQEVDSTVGLVKFNTDAEVSRVGERGAIVVVCRDETRMYLGASVIYTGISDSSTLEALACREALSLVYDLGVHHLYIVSDCLSVIKNIKERGVSSTGQSLRKSQVGRFLSLLAFFAFLFKNLGAQTMRLTIFLGMCFL